MKLDLTKVRVMLPDSKEVIGTVGFGLFVAGVAMLSIAAALMVAGALMFGYAFITSKPTKSERGN